MNNDPIAFYIDLIYKEINLKRDEIFIYLRFYPALLVSIWALLEFAKTFLKHGLFIC